LTFGILPDKGTEIHPSDMIPSVANPSVPDPEPQKPDDLKRARREAEQLVSLLRATLDATADGILVVDLTGNIVTFNQRFVRMWRLPESLVSAGNSRDTLAFVLDQLKDPAAFVKKTMELYARPEREGLDVVEFKDGRVFERFSGPQRIGGEIVGRVSSFRDVTERLLADDEIESTLSLLRTTLDATADGLLVVSTEGRIELYNRRFVDLWRIPEEIVACRDDARILNFVLNQLKNPERFLKKVKEIYGEPESQSYDWLEFKDGRVIERNSCPQRVGQRTVGRVWSFHDVTDRRRQEEILQRQARTFEHITDGVLLTDLDGRVLDWNPGAEKMFGYAKEEVLGRPAPVFGGAEESGQRLKAMLETVRREGRWAEEVVFYRREGATGIGQFLADRVWDQYGRTVSIILVAHDVTEHRRLERQINELRQRRASA
jgi:PAS domain S-box-containing protein